MSKASNATLLISFAGAYAALAWLCLALPSAFAGYGVAGFALLGPPALLLCGDKAWPVFAGITLVLSGLLYLALRSSAGRFPAILAAALIWLLTGYLSTVLSI